MFFNVASINRPVTITRFGFKHYNEVLLKFGNTLNEPGSHNYFDVPEH